MKNENTSINNFEKFITHIRYPHFKNLQTDLRLDFTYPVTILTGPNGTNKSSILRSLQCCCTKNVLETHWFATDLDNINPDQKYIFGYKVPSGMNVESLQVYKGNSSKTDRSKDYWESDRPRKMYSMKLMKDYPNNPKDKNYKSDRWKKINTEVIYLDFRSELPAFDILMNFTWRNNLRNNRERKRFIRTRSHILEEVFKNDPPKKSHKIKGSERILRPLIDLSPENVTAISQILGKEYSKISLVKHDLFDAQGYTAQLYSGEKKYSEAFAGSGEFATIMLVHAISSARDNSLILLDEPETSLHPGAQKELMDFILQKSIEKKSQVVIATHAPALIESLPPQAIKALDIDPIDNKIILKSQECSPKEAFLRIGASVQNEKINIIVEDQLAKAFLIAAMSRFNGAESILEAEIKIYPGGASAINKYAGLSSLYDSPVYIVLDGDQRPKYPISNGNLEIREISEIEKDFKKTNINFSDIPKNSSHTNTTDLDLKKRILRWYRDHVFYLPTNKDPDTLLALMHSNKISQIDTVDNNYGKKYWRSETERLLGIFDDSNSSKILFQQEVAINTLLESSDKNIISIFDEIETIFSSIQNQQ